MPTLLENLSLAFHAFWRLFARRSSSSFTDRTNVGGVLEPNANRQPPTRFSWSYLFVLFACGRRTRGDSSFYADGDLEAGAGAGGVASSTSSGRQQGHVRKAGSFKGEFVNIDLNDENQQRESQNREPSSFMPPKYYFPLPTPAVEVQQENPDPISRRGVVLSDILDQFPLPPASQPSQDQKEVLKEDSIPSIKLVPPFPLPLTPTLDFENDGSPSSFSSEFESMLSLSFESSSSTSCFSTPPTTPPSAVLPAWCEYHTSNIAKREEAYRKMRQSKKKKRAAEKEREDRKRVQVDGPADTGDAESTKRSRSDSPPRSTSPTLPGECKEVVDGSDVDDRRSHATEGDPPGQTHDEAYVGRVEANNSQRDVCLDAADDRNGAEVRCEAESQEDRGVLHQTESKAPPKPVRSRMHPPVRVFIPGHKRSPPIFTLPENCFFTEDSEDTYAGHSFITQPHAHHKPISVPRILKKLSCKKTTAPLTRQISDGKQDMTNVLRAFNEMVLGTEEDFRDLFEGESLSTGMASRDTTQTLNSTVEDILPAMLSRNGKTSLASRLARAHKISARTIRRDGQGGFECEESLTSDDGSEDEEKMAPEEWFDMLGWVEYLV